MTTTEQYPEEVLTRTLDEERLEAVFTETDNSILEPKKQYPTSDGLNYSQNERRRQQRRR